MQKHHEAARRILDATIARQDASALVREYYDRPAGDRGGFTGAWFERIGGGGDAAAVANQFTGTDLVAVTMLSVSVPPRAAKVILEERAGRFAELLGAIRVDVDPASEVGAALLRNREGPLWKLWRELEELHGIGWVTAGKLVARKRPGLAPVYDNIVGDHLGWPQGFWGFITDAFEDDALVQRLTTIREEAGVPDVTLLRVLDVLLWRVEQGHGLG